MFNYWLTEVRSRSILSRDVVRNNETWTTSCWSLQVLQIFYGMTRCTTLYKFAWINISSFIGSLQNFCFPITGPETSVILPSILFICLDHTRNQGVPWGLIHSALGDEAGKKESKRNEEEFERRIKKRAIKTIQDTQCCWRWTRCTAWCYQKQLWSKTRANIRLHENTARKYQMSTPLFHKMSGQRDHYSHALWRQIKIEPDSVLCHDNPLACLLGS